MNKDKWESLPPEIKTVFRKASDKNFLRKIGQVWREDEQRGVDLMTKFKREHIVLTKEETEAFRVKLEPVIDKWVDDVSKDGIDGKRLVKKARALIAKYSSP